MVRRPRPKESRGHQVVIACKTSSGPLMRLYRGVVGRSLNTSLKNFRKFLSRERSRSTRKEMAERAECRVP